jgi:hypothetical protein
VAEKEMTDHQFAVWLRAREWQGEHRHVGKTCEFVNSRGEVLAVAIYDNHNCTRTTRVMQT